MDGVFLSNGPGDRPPPTRRRVDQTGSGEGIPLFGICFGNQILGRALGRGTYKMKFGHRGINIPVIDSATGKVSITARTTVSPSKAEAGENSTPTSAAPASATCAPTTASSKAWNWYPDKRFRCSTTRRPAAGPHDAAYLFDKFATLLEGTRA